MHRWHWRPPRWLSPGGTPGELFALEEPMLIRVRLGRSPLRLSFLRPVAQLRLEGASLRHLLATPPPRSIAVRGWFNSPRSGTLTCFRGSDRWSADSRLPP